MKTLAVLTTNSGHYGKLNDTYKHLDPLKPGNNTLFAPVRGVNVMLGGVMLSAIILVIFVLCYCCHKTNRKTPTTNQIPPSTYWRDPGLSMEIYTVDRQNCMDYEEYSSDSRRSSLPGPPPPYELVVLSNDDKSCETPSTPQLPDNLEPPSYEKACQLQEFQIVAQGYV